MQADRRFMRDHIEELLSIERESFADPKNGNIFSSLYDDAAAHMHYFVAQSDTGVIGGYLILSLAADEAEIINVAVPPALRRRGIGVALVDEALAFAAARGAAACYLEVRESNRPARRLYEKMSFNVVGVRKMYYSAPSEDAIVMRRTLEAACNDR